MSDILLNRAAVKRYTMKSVAEQRAHLQDKFTRISAEYLNRIEAHLREYINEQVRNMPSTGKTIK